MSENNNSKKDGKKETMWTISKESVEASSPPQGKKPKVPPAES